MKRSLSVHLLGIGPLASSEAQARACHPGALTGRVTHVRDGDTIVVGAVPIRLAGLAAPEHNELGVSEGTAAMVELVADSRKGS